MKPDPSKILIFSFIFSVFVFFCSFSAAQKLIVVEKCSRTLYLYVDKELKEAFPVSLGFDPLSAKRRKGDGATPEGVYYVTEKHHSRRYHLFVGLSYPNFKDIMLAQWEGRLGEEDFEACLKRYQSCPLGYGIGIHGGGVIKEGQRDWTYGCIALDNADMARVYGFAEPGMPVLIYDAEKPLFETLKHLVLWRPNGSVGDLWRGQWEFVSLGLLLRVSLWEDNQGHRQLTMIGYRPDSREIVFWFNDRNGNGILEPWEPQRCYQKCERYQQLKIFILENLPQWVEIQTLGRGG